MYRYTPYHRPSAAGKLIRCWRGLLMLLLLLLLSSCSTKNNTGRSRWWHAFNARYNTYYNGSLAFIDGAEEKENGNKDNFTEMIPLYTVGNKSSVDLGKANFDRAIEKAEKAIKLHSIKKRPEWKKSRRKNAKDVEWLSRREYNPFIWKAWLLMGKSQFQTGKFDEAAATFSYMSRLYATQPAINGIARAWLAKSYVELDWLYDAEDVITKMKRDTMHYRARADWDYTLADFHIRSKQYAEAVPYLEKVIKHEKRRKQKAREWYLMGQLQAELGNRTEAYKAFGHVVRLNPPYQLEFNARIAQTEVMAGQRSKQMIRKLKRMAASDKNQEYLDQVYYAIGNIHLLQKDTVQAIAAYEKGNEKATRSGIEKGVLLLHLGNLYWQMEKYSDAKRCYGEAIGLLDKERPDYEELDHRSKVLDELVPHTEAVHLQDSLQQLAAMNEADRNKAIDRVIEALIKKEKEEKRKQQEAEAEQQLQKQGAVGNRTNQRQNANQTQNQQKDNKGGGFYFYNPMTVNQGKTAFQQQWGKRENVDDWQRSNRTVVNLASPSDEQQADSELAAADSTAIADSIDAPKPDKEQAEADSAANDPHKREYYLAQIPFTEEQKAASDDIIKEGLFNAGVIFKDKLDNLRLSEKSLLRLTGQYADYAKNDEAWYHLFLLYSRLGMKEKAADCLLQLQSTYPESQWTLLLSNPYFEENARFGVQIEDSIYTATYQAFKENRFDEVMANVKLSEERFPMGANRPKFVFVEGLSLLNQGEVDSALVRMKTVVEKYPDNEVSPIAGMIVKGVQEGRTIHGGKFDIGDIWSRRTVQTASADSASTDTLSVERNTNYIFLLAYQPDSVNANQLLYEMAKYNFTNFMVRNFEIATDYDGGIARMLISGFLSYDEALQYARKLYADAGIQELLHACRRVIISEANLKLLGTRYSYNDYELFFEEQLAPIQITDEQLLTIPATIEQRDPEEEASEEGEEEGNDGNESIGGNQDAPIEDGFDFDEDFYR